MFGKGNFFLEMQDHGLAPDKAVCDASSRLEQELNIPVIATNDSHYVGADDSAPTKSCSACRPPAA